MGFEEECLGPVLQVALLAFKHAEKKLGIIKICNLRGKRQ
jgi:hypothetical protein